MHQTTQTSTKHLHQDRQVWPSAQETQRLLTRGNSMRSATISALISRTARKLFVTLD